MKKYLHHDLFLFLKKVKPASNYPPFFEASIYTIHKHTSNIERNKNSFHEERKKETNLSKPSIYLLSKSIPPYPFPLLKQSILSIIASRVEVYF